MKFSLITTCLNEIRSINEWISDIENQTFSPNEIVIVDSFSIDGTFEILNEWSKKNEKVKVYRKKCTVAQGRNYAILNSSHSYIISTDMGVRLEKDWFKEIVQPFIIDDTIDLVVGSYRYDLDIISSCWTRSEAFLNNCGIPILKPGFLPSNRSIAYKKEIWEKVGYYPEDLSYATDDTIFGHLINNIPFINIHYANEAIVLWKRHSKLSEYKKEAYAYGKGNGEANIYKYRLSSLTKKMNLLAPFLYGFISSFGAIKKVLKNLPQIELIFLIYAPLFKFHYFYSYAKGYKVGLKLGATKCQKTRMNLYKSVPHILNSY